MGQNSILNTEQRLILDEIKLNKFLRSNFYFTGGTALSELYLQHRESIDLDFFSNTKYDPQSISHFITKLSIKHKFKFEAQYLDPTHIYFLNFKNDKKLKLDFAHYPYKRLKKGKTYQGLKVDSKLDIAVNKVFMINSQRIEVKDFVDLYFLLQEFTIWDLIQGVEIKFNTKIEPYILASSFLAVENFDFLPNMFKSLKLDQLKKIFVAEAKSLGKSATI